MDTKANATEDLVHGPPGTGRMTGLSLSDLHRYFIDRGRLITMFSCAFGVIWTADVYVIVSITRAMY